MRAAEALLEVVDRGRSLDAALAAQAAPAAERARLRELAAGGCRHYHRFDALLARLVQKPLTGRARVVHCLLINACHQIAGMRTPDHAAVSEAVGAVAGTPHAWAGGLINAALRNFLRRREELERELATAAGVGDGEGDGESAGDGGIEPRHPRSPHHRHPRASLSGGGDGDHGGDGHGDGDHGGDGDAGDGDHGGDGHGDGDHGGDGDGDAGHSDSGAGDGGDSGAGDSSGAATAAAAAAWFAHPLWLYREIRAHWPRHHRAILEAGNQKPPLTLRVGRRISRDAYLANLARAGLDAQPTADSALGVTLDAPMPVARIPGFAAGLVSVQDESAQLALAALGPVPAGARVLDACAAPGGKTGLLLEAGATVTAVDLPARVELLRENLARLGFATDDGDRDRDSGDGDGDCDRDSGAGDGDRDGGNGDDGDIDGNRDGNRDSNRDSDSDSGDTVKTATVIAGDLTAPAAWWTGARFDRILLDVPCSASGVIRRHPDIKHRRRATDIAKFAAQQLKLMRAAWALLAAGGSLLYVTCSILPAENDAVIARFIDLQSDAEAQPIDASLGAQTRFGVQRLPGVHAGDGFYFCRVQKRAQLTADAA